MTSGDWKPGDWAVYRKQKHSTSPGPRAKDVHPAPAGDAYTYAVDKYWVVEEVLPGGSLRLKTRRGKRHTVSAADPSLRRLKWWERWLLASRFDKVARSQKEP